MASLYVKYPKACRNKKSSVCMTPPASLTSSSTGSLSSNDGVKSSSPTTTISQSKRKQHVYHHAHIIRSPKLTLPKRKKLKLKKSPTSSSDSDTTQKLDKCRAFIINSNNNIQDEIDRNCCFDSTSKKKLSQKKKFNHLWLEKSSPHFYLSVKVHFCCSLISVSYEWSVDVCKNYFNNSSSINV